MRKWNIGIMGVGMVGGAMHRYFQSMGIAPTLYDTGKNIGDVRTINNADLIFLCVPTPFNEATGAFDNSSILDAINCLDGEKVVVIKSTIIPGTTENLQEQYPNFRLFFNPEFLSEATADSDMMHPDRQLIGYTAKSEELALEILSLLPRAPFEKTMKATEAELVKYFNNTFNAIKVIFANQMYDLTEAVGARYEEVMEAAAASKFIRTQDHLHIWHNGYRGYNGKCLPKDLKSILSFANQINVDLPLLECANQINEDLLSKKL